MYNLLKEKLIELKHKYGAAGLKIEFETECISLDEVIEVRRLTKECGVDLAVKIGGCGAIRDIFEAKEVMADVIVAPMIESGYALKKFVSSVEDVYNDFAEIPELHINIETEQGVLNFSKIVSCKEFKKITGVVIGRNDMAKSYGIEDAENDLIRKNISVIANKANKCGKKVIVGGKVTPESDFLFFPSIAKCETRKIIFNNFPETDGILKALEFEALFIENKKNKSSEDYARLRELKTRMPVVIVR